jgi:hypothetical protein
MEAFMVLALGFGDWALELGLEVAALILRHAAMDRSEGVTAQP